MEELGIHDYLTIVRRWKKLFLATTIILLILTLSVALHWSNYRSIGVVQIEQAQISSNATIPIGENQHDVIQALADQRISAIEEKVTSTASLIDIITKFDLYAKARQRKPVAAIADAMRKKIKVTLVNDTIGSTSTNKEDMSSIAFTVSFDYSDPLLTQQVTDDLVTRFLDEDLRERRTEAEETSAFLGNQITALEATMSDQEKKIADYEKEHGITRPEALAFNQQAAANATMNLQNLETQLTTNEGSLGALRAQLVGTDPYSRVIADGQVMTTPSVQLKALQTQYASLTAQYGPEHPDVVKVRHQIEALRAQVGGKSKDFSQLKAQIADVRTNLDVAEKTYGPDHPDVVALQNQLQKLEDRLAMQKTGTTQPTDGIVGDADNPAYLQVVSQLRAAEEQHKALLAQHDELKTQQDAYQKAIMENPEAEKEMAALTRDYDNAQLRYRELKEKKLTADMDQQMQSDRKGQRLTLIDPPELPLDTHPARIILMLAAAMISLLGGLASIVIAQIYNQSVVGIHHLESLVGAAPLVAIPHIYTNEERQRSIQRRACEMWDKITQRLGQTETPL